MYGKTNAVISPTKERKRDRVGPESPGRGWKKREGAGTLRSPLAVWASAETERPGRGYAAS